MQIYMMVFNNVPLFPDWYLSKDDIFPQRLSETLLQMPLVASWLQHTDNLYLCRLSGESSCGPYKRLFLLPGQGHCLSSISIRLMRESLHILHIQVLPASLLNNIFLTNI